MMRKFNDRISTKNLEKFAENASKSHTGFQPLPHIRTPGYVPTYDNYNISVPLNLYKCLQSDGGITIL